ncbi:MAG TPA: tetratricopeptide repeat protein [Longimicrobiales bacterium]|nr:tetratricopeptide repeat protein [Longimicrobiales bacterium]
MIDSHRDEIAKLESLFAMNPEGRVFTHLAEAYRKAGQLERARQVLEEGLQQHADYASAHVVLGRVLEDSGHDEQATAEFRRVLELDRHNLVALRSLGQRAVRAGQTEEALHYYGELAVLDPTDPEIQDTLRGLTDQRSTEPAAAREPDAVTGDSGAVEIEMQETAGDMDGSAVPRMQGIDADPYDTDPIESSDTEPEPVEEAPPEPASAWPETEPANLAGWPEASSGEETAQPGEAPPLDEAAWREISGAGGHAVEESQAESDPIEATAAGDESATMSLSDPIEEEHSRFAPPPQSEPDAAEPSAAHPDAREAGSEAEAGPDDDAGAGSPDADEDGPEVEGRWQPPAPSVADAQAELTRPPDYSAEWISADRWEWVAGSADEPGGSSSAPSDEDGEDESSPEMPVSEAGGFDEETSFADVMESEPVDTFEEGAAAVLDAFSRSSEELEGDDILADDESGSAFAFGAGHGEADDDSPVSWVTDRDDEGDMVITETLAEIYASQGLHDRAVAVYRRLIEQHPGDDRLLARLSDLESAAGWTEEGSAQPAEAGEEGEAFLERVESAWTGGQGVAATEDTLYAWAEPTADPVEGGPSARDYFASLLAWRPAEAVPSDFVAESAPASAGEAEDWYGAEADREPDGGEAGEPGREGEEDLEMFRSWLKSLKK